MSKPPASSASPLAHPKLIADAMLGGLARWLRVLGLDTAFDPGLDDPELVDRALAEEREIPSEEAAREVPPYVARTQERFRRCPRCGRIFWRATHARRMRTRLRKMGIEPRL